MISVSWYSFFSAVTIFSVALVIVFALRSRTDFLKRYSVSVLILTSALALFRLVLPLDFLFSYVVESKMLIPVVRNFFQTYSLASWALIVVWSCGAAVVLGRDVYLLIRAYAISKRYIIIKDPLVDKCAASLSVGCPVLVSPDVDVPYVSGIFRKTIYVPDMELSNSEANMILMHEIQHIRSHDSEFKLFWGLLSAVLWWNPIVIIFRREIDALLEFRCDAKVTEPMKPTGRTEYVEMLLRIKKRSVVVPRKSTLALNESAVLNVSDDIFEQRCRVLIDNLDKEPRRVNLGVKIALAVLFLASYLIIFQPVFPVPVEEEDMVDLVSGDCVTSDEILGTLGSNCIIKIDDHYYLFSEGRQGVELSPEEVFSEIYKDYIILEECVP